MSQAKRSRKAKGVRLKKYRVTILPTFGPVEVEAGSPDEAEELATHYWDTDWDGEFVSRVEEVTEDGPRDGGEES